MITRKVYPFPKWYLDLPTLAQKDYAQYLSKRFNEPLPTKETKGEYSEFISYCKARYSAYLF